jgi:type II secretory pathway pseudopilin PulG
MTIIPISSICPLSGRCFNGLDEASLNTGVRGSEFGNKDSWFRVQGSGARKSSFIPHPSSLILHPSAFTLIEVILTLCLLVIIGALAWPQLEKSFSRQRLRKSADIVRTQWCKARVESMKMGSIRVFRYEIEGNRYRIDMLSTDSAALLTGSTTDTALSGNSQITPDNNASAGTTQNSSSFAGTPVSTEQTLPKDIFFVSSQTTSDAGTIMMATSAASASSTPPADASTAGNANSIGAAWSEPIYFYPDGTTSSTRLLLRNKEGLTINLFMRGITGIVTVSDVIAGGQTSL